jgi:protoporphyrinogen oxidase
MATDKTKYDAVIVGGGFCGLSAAYELAKAGLKVALCEKRDRLGGIAESFQLENGHFLEKYYHHWFRNDADLIAWAKELHIEHLLTHCTSRTGLFWKGAFYKLSSPLDLLFFKPLKFRDRIRLGLLVPRTKWIKDWETLESITAQEWLLKSCGKEAFEIIWQPLLRGKFGTYASSISAVWFWNKVMLRGNSRDLRGREILLYPQNGFNDFIERIADKIRLLGGDILTNTQVLRLETDRGSVQQVTTTQGTLIPRCVLATTPLSDVAHLLQDHCTPAYLDSLRNIKHLANVCLILELNQPLSDLYWINVSDPQFPFVGIIEHTNFQSPALYGNRHIVYLSCYLKENDPFFLMPDEAIMTTSLPHIQRVFPRFQRDWVLNYHVFKCRDAQPIVGLHHSAVIPDWKSPLDNFYLATMSQIYPEDRGTNYAIREGRAAGQALSKMLRSPSPSTGVQECPY